MSISAKFLALLLPAIIFFPGKILAEDALPHTMGEARMAAAVPVSSSDNAQIVADARQITVVAGQSVEAKPLPPDTKPLAPHPEEKPAAAPAQAKPAQTKAVPAPSAPVAAKPAPAPVAAESKPDASKQADAPDTASAAPSEFIKDDTAAVISAPEASEGEADASDPGQGTPATAADIVKAPEGHGLLAPIARNIQYFSITVKKHFQQWLARSGKYMGLMKSILRENYMPEDLVFLALIESGFNPKAYSWAKACGPWQFIKGTAVRYGLRVDQWVDERRDPIKSTKAAAAYLKDLYGAFGSWPLAMASYNSGEGNVARAINRTGGVNDFWQLRKTRYMPSETKDYVPKFIAARMIAENPDSFGFKDLEYEEPFVFDEVQLNHCTDLRTAARCCGVSVEDIKDLNPELIRGCTPPNRAYTLRIPKGKKEAFLAAYNALPESERFATPKVNNASTRYVVRRGDTLKKIADKVGVSVTRLAAANRLKVNAKVRKGRRLIVPREEVVIASAEPVDRSRKCPAKESAPTQDAKADAAADTKAVADTDTKTAAIDDDTAASQPEAKPEEKSGPKIELGSLLPESVANADETEIAQAPADSSDDNAPRHRVSHTVVSAYTVKKGDTLASIAKAHGIPAAKLAKMNGIGKRKKLKAGQKLALSGGRTGGHARTARASSRHGHRRIASSKRHSRKKYQVASSQ